MPQPQTPGAVFPPSPGQPSTQSAVPSLSPSASVMPQPHMPGAVFNMSMGHSSMQSGVPSSSVSSSGTPQPQALGSAQASVPASADDPASGPASGIGMTCASGAILPAVGTGGRDPPAPPAARPALPALPALPPPLPPGGGLAPERPARGFSPMRVSRRLSL